MERCGWEGQQFATSKFCLLQASYYLPYYHYAHTNFSLALVRLRIDVAGAVALMWQEV